MTEKIIPLEKKDAVYEPHLRDGKEHLHEVLSRSMSNDFKVLNSWMKPSSPFCCQIINIARQKLLAIFRSDPNDLYVVITPLQGTDNELVFSPELKISEAAGTRDGVKRNDQFHLQEEPTLFWLSHLPREEEYALLADGYWNLATEYRDYLNRLISKPSSHARVEHELQEEVDRIWKSLRVLTNDYYHRLYTRLYLPPFEKRIGLEGQDL